MYNYISTYKRIKYVMCNPLLLNAKSVKTNIST